MRGRWNSGDSFSNSSASYEKSFKVKFVKFITPPTKARAATLEIIIDIYTQNSVLRKVQDNYGEVNLAPGRL